MDPQIYSFSCSANHHCDRLPLEQMSLHQGFSHCIFHLHTHSTDLGMDLAPSLNSSVGAQRGWSLGCAGYDFYMVFYCHYMVFYMAFYIWYLYLYGISWPLCSIVYGNVLSLCVPPESSSCAWTPHAASLVWSSIYYSPRVIYCTRINKTWSLIYTSVITVYSY